MGAYLKNLQGRNTQTYSIILSVTNYKRSYNIWFFQDKNTLAYFAPPSTTRKGGFIWLALGRNDDAGVGGK